MFYKYEIKNINNEDCLFLYLSNNYEFSNEFQNSEKLEDISKYYIKINNIKFSGKKIYYVVNGIVTKSSVINNTINNNYSPDNFLVNIKFNDNSLCEMSLRDYLLNILFSYYNEDIGDEVYKSICILFNTYAYKMMKESNSIMANSNFNSYKYYSEYENIYNNFKDIVYRFNSIIDFCSCIYLSYNGDYILPFIHLCSCGKTLENVKYPYLKSVKSLWDLASKNYINIYDFKYEYLSSILKIKINNDTKIQSRKDGSLIFFDNNSFYTSDLQRILNLNSNNITIILNKSFVRFITKGIGNSLGLSIYGSMAIENNGGNYNNILSYYFPKVKIFKYIKELS